VRTVAASTSNSCADAPHPSPLPPHLSPLTPHSSPLTPHPSPWKALTPAVAKYKDWASKNQDAAFVAAIEISFDPTPLASGCGLPPPPPRARSPPSTPTPTHLRALAADIAPPLQHRRRRGDRLRREDQP